MKLFSLIIISFFIIGCSQRVSEVKKNVQYKKIVSVDCLSTYLMAKKYYEKYEELDGIDTKNFFPAISLFEQAKEICKFHEYEDDVIYSLANAYFYIGDYSQAYENYNEIAKVYLNSSFNIGSSSAIDEAEFLKRCKDDRYIDNYRKAELYELHKEIINAIEEYKKSSQSLCLELSKRSQKKIQILNYTKK